MLSQWWRDAVVYQVYPRSFADGSGDGTGDFTGALARLPYLADLGVEAVWFSPFYPSPLADGGYDVADYCDVDPRFGTLADFDAFVAGGGRARHPGDRRHRAQPLLVGPPGVPGRAGGRPGQPRARPVHVPRRAQQLAVDLRRPGVDPGRGRPVVPAPVRHLPARLQLAEPGRPGDVREGHPVLARPGRGRAAGRRGPRPAQGPRAARRGRPGAVRPALALVPPARAHRPLRVVAGDPRLLPARRLPRRAHGGGRVLGHRDHPPGALLPARRHAAGLQLLPVPDRLGRRRAEAHHHHLDRPGRRVRRGRALGDQQPRRGPPGDPLRRRPAGHPRPRTSTSTWAPAGPARRRCCCSRCPARPTSTRARNSASPRSSTSPTTSATTRSSTAPPGPASAATAAASRFPGPVRPSPTASPKGVDLAAPADHLGPAHRGGPAGRPRLDPEPLQARHRGPAARGRVRLARPGRRRDRLLAGATGSPAWSTWGRRRSR